MVGKKNSRKKEKKINQKKQKSNYFSSFLVQKNSQEISKK
jgi:hypothetical protein